LWEPGSAWRYSNTAFDALADVIAKASGRSFEAYVRSKIIEPLGMVDSSFIYPEIATALRPTGHVGKVARVSNVYPYNRRHAPSSTLNSNVIDMTSWMLANLNRAQWPPNPASYELRPPVGADNQGGRQRMWA